MKSNQGSLKELASEGGVTEMFIDLMLPPRNSLEPRACDLVLDTLKGIDSNLTTISSTLKDVLLHLTNSSNNKTMYNTNNNNNNSSNGFAEMFTHSNETDVEVDSGFKRIGEKDVIDVCFYAVSKLDFERIYGILKVKPEVVFERSNQHRTLLNAAAIANSEVMVRVFTNLAFRMCKQASEVQQFLDAIDTEFQINAYQIATINGNQNILDILEGAKKHVITRTTTLYEFENTYIPMKQYWNNDCIDGMSKAHSNLKHVRELVDPILKHVKQGTNWSWYERLQFKVLRGQCFEMIKDEESCIQPSKLWGNEYVLHQLFGSLFVSDEGMCLLKDVCKCLKSGFLPYVLHLWDNSGRTPFHVLVDNFDVEDYQMKTILEIIDFHCPNVLDLNMADVASRTPFFRAASIGNHVAVKVLVEDPRTKTNVGSVVKGHEVPRHRSVVKLHASMGVTPLHIAVFHNHHHVVEVLLHACKTHHAKLYKPSTSKLDLNRMCEHARYTFKCTPFQLAAFKGYTQIIQLLLKEDELEDKSMVRCEKYGAIQSQVPALHLAVAGGHPAAVQMLLASDRINPFSLDQQCNTALHYAARAFDDEFHEMRHLTPVDYVSMDHFRYNPPRRTKPSFEVIGCMELLLQAGLDMNQQNVDGCAAELSEKTPEPVRKWWYEKFTKQTQEQLQNIFVTANAVSITAALVATTSFAGPLQPPLGFAQDVHPDWLNGYGQFSHPTIEAFFFCDNLTFYFSMTSIILILIPYLPVTNEGILREIHVAKKSVQAAVVVLFISIVFLIAAFFCAALSIVPKDRWKYKSLTALTIGTGGMVCVVVLSLFCLRLLRVVKVENAFVVNAYNAIVVRLKSSERTKTLVRIVHTHVLVKRAVVRWKRAVKRGRLERAAASSLLTGSTR